MKTSWTIYSVYCQPCYTPAFVADGAPSFGSATPAFGQQEASPDETPSPVRTPASSGTPVVQTVHLINPAETQTTLGFAVNGQTYSLEAGQSQDMQINDSSVIEFDRGGDNQTGRYSLSAGVYRFASTPQGWELYRGEAAPTAESVASN